VPGSEQRAETARQLREEAHALLADSGLFALLQHGFGEATVTGSAGYDLMVRRDIDIHLAVGADRWTDWMAFGGTLVRHFERAGMPLRRACYVNDWLEPGPLGAGLCWQLAFTDLRHAAWTIDLWGWDPFDFAVRQARDFSLRTDLAACDRDLILRLKTEAQARPGYYGTRVTGIDIYRFAIAGAGDSLSALEAWKQQG